MVGIWWSVFVEALLLYDMTAANDSNIFALLHVHVFKINRRLLKVSSFVFQVPDCYLRGWRSGANFIKPRINNCHLSFHPLFPPVLYTYLPFCTPCLNSSQQGPACCGNVPLGGLDPPVILSHRLVLPGLAECLLSFWGYISFTCWLQKWFVIGTANIMRRFPFGLPLFFGLPQKLCFCQISLVAPCYGPAAAFCTCVTVLLLGLHFSKTCCVWEDAGLGHVPLNGLSTALSLHENKLSVQSNLEEERHFPNTAWIFQEVGKKGGWGN